MNRVIQFIVIGILFLLHGRCKDAYDFNTVSQPGILIVDGNINDLPGPYLLTLSTTVSANLRPDPVTKAFVTITDNQGNQEGYTELGSGKYQLTGTFVQGVPGRSYVLKIKLSDGRTYQSTSELLPTNGKLRDSVFFNVTENKVLSSEGASVNNWQVNIFLSSDLSQTNSGYFRWAVEEVYSLFPTCFPGAISCPPICYIHQPITYYNLKVINRANYAGSSLQNIELESREVDYSFATRHFFNVFQYSMNPSAFSYWSKIQELVTKRGSIFDTPPYTIVGNVTNINNPQEMVFGYFEASGATLTRKFVDRGYIPTFVQTCFLNLPDYIPNTYFCADCTGMPGSSIEEPYWFWH